MNINYNFLRYKKIVKQRHLITIYLIYPINNKKTESFKYTYF